MIHILMAVFNGEKYLREQLESIVRQTVTDWKLYIHDDGSRDGTIGIIEEFALKYPDKVELFYETQHKSSGAKCSFSKLVEQVREDGDYAFCDQDDIWDDDKLEVLRKELRRTEKNKNNKITPSMVCSDARLIDEKGNVTEESLAEKSGLFISEEHMFERLFLYNFAQGCTMLWNIQLHRLIKHIPKEAIMHDWWVALVAAGHGRISFIPKQLLSYRQHTGNVIGGFDKEAWHKSFLGKLRIGNLKNLLNNNRDLKNERYNQAMGYSRMYGSKQAARYIEIVKKNRISRTVLGIKEGYIFLSKTYSVKYYIL